MKKLIYCAAAIAMAFFAGSCQQEMLEPVAQETTVTYSVELPKLQTKAIGDGFNVDQLVYEVWKTEGKNVRDLTDVTQATRLYHETAKMEKIDGEQKTIITLNLVHDQNYTILFWAQNSQAVVDANGQKVPAYVTDDLTNVSYAKEVTADGSYLSNNENMAAFYKAEFLTAEEIERPNGIRRTELKRPFAQLNIGTKNTAEEYTVAMNTSKVKISRVPKTFDVAQNIAADSKTGTPASPAVYNSSEFVFDYNTVPNETERLWVNGDEYEYVAMNYIFANGNVEVEYWIDATLTATDPTAGRNETTNAIIYNKVPQVPLMENYRTNIVGNLLTSTTQYEVVIDADFETPKNAPEKIVVLTAEELQKVLDNAVVGDNAIYLGNGIAGDVMVHQKPGVNIVLYGQNQTYEGTIRIHNGSNYNDGKFTVKDVNFKTSTAGHNFIMPNDFDAVAGVARRYSNNVTVENCTFTSEGDAVNTAVGVQAKSCKNLKVIGCTATGVHSLLQAQSCGTDVIVKDCTITGKNGVAFKQVKNAVVEGAKIIASAYGIRFDGNIDNYGITIKDCNVTAVQPVIVRKMTGKNNTIAFVEGTNTLVTDETFQVVITDGSDDEEYSYPTGTYTLTGNKGLNVYPIVNADAFAAAVANEKLSEVVVDADIESVGQGFEITRDVVLNMNNKVFNAGSTPTSYWYAIEVKGENEVDIKNANFTRSGVFASEGADVVFHNGKIANNPERTSRYIFAANDAGTTITIKDGDFTNDRAKNNYFWADGGAIIYVEGGNFGGVASNNKVVTTNGGQVVISGGTFNFDPTNWLANGYTATKNGKTWVVSAKNLVTNADELAEAIEAGNDGNVIILEAGATFEGTFVPGSKGLVIKSSKKDNKATIKGRVNIDGYAEGISFENVKFEINDASAAKNTFSGANYKYPAIVTIYAASTSFEGCEFKTNYASGVCGINYGAHAAEKILTVNNCKFVGDFYAIRSRTLFSVTNSVFDTYTDQGTLAAVFTWGNGEAGTQGNSGANSVVFTGNTNANTNQIRGVQLSSTTYNYCHINYNIQSNENFIQLSECVNPACDFTGKTFTAGSETF